MREQPLKASQSSQVCAAFFFREQPLKASQLYIAIVLTFVGKNQSVLKLRVSDKHFTWIEPVTEHSEQSQIYCENQGHVYAELMRKREVLNIVVFNLSSNKVVVTSKNSTELAQSPVNFIP